MSTRFERDALRARAEAAEAALRERDIQDLKAQAASLEQAAQAHESARLTEQLRVHLEQTEEVRRARWSAYVLEPGSPEIERLIAGAVTMDDLIPAEGWPPGESAEEHLPAAPRVDAPDPPPLVIEARKRGLDI